MVKRSLSTLILAPPFLAAIWFGFPYFDLLIGVLSVLAMLELLVITSQGDSEIDIYVALLGFCFGSVFFVVR